jgi:UDP-2,4-diacetamido-2,4,6-trideoxy-beta-L-altropyranose hydrolase
MRLLLRRAVEGDAARVFAWRNHESVRRASLDPDAIDWSDHCAWFRRTLERADRCLLIADDGEAPVGVLRFDVKGEVAEISIFLDPQKVGLGYGTAILREGATWARCNLAGVATLRARIKSDNQASLHIFEKAGFAEAWRVYDMNLWAKD